MKLYNAGSFFDPRAVPPADDEAIGALLSPLRRVVVESHPALVGERTWRFQEQLASRGAGPALEVAMGLETAHPEALARLNKRMTLERFAAAARQLAATACACGCSCWSRRRSSRRVRRTCGSRAPWQRRSTVARRSCP